MTPIKVFLPCDLELPRGNKPDSYDERLRQQVALCANLQQKYLEVDQR